MVRCDVDLALGVARRRDRLGQFQPEAVAGMADHAHAVDRAIDVAGEPRDQRIGLGRAGRRTSRRRPGT